MRSRIGRQAAILAAIMVFAAGSVARAESWRFDDVSRIRLEGVSGNVVLLPSAGGDVSVRLESTVSPSSMFRGRVEEVGGTLRLNEDWGRGSGSGEVVWTIYLPGRGGEEVSMSTSSGSLEARDITVRLDLDTASGSIDLTDVELEADSELSTASGDYALRNMRLRSGSELSTASGDFNLTDVDLERGVEISTASGDIRCTGCRGPMELSTASGDVTVRESRIDGASRFSTASGDVELNLDAMPGYDVEASSASGDVRLHADDYGGSYSLVLRAREDRGRIITPFDYTATRTFRDHHPYQEKTVVRGSGGPKITLSTASGDVVVERI